MVEISSCRRIESISGVKTSRKEQRNELTNFLDIDKPIDKGNVLERPLRRRDNISEERFNGIIRMCLEPRNSGDHISLSSPKNFVVQYFTVSRNHPVKICGRPQCPLAAEDDPRTEGKKQQPRSPEVVEKTERSRSPSSEDPANEHRDFPVELTVTPCNIEGVKGRRTPRDNSEQSPRQSCTLGVISRCSSRTYSIASSKSSKRHARGQTNREECWRRRCSKFIINLPVTLSDKIFGPRAPSGASEDEKQNSRDDRPSPNGKQNAKLPKNSHRKHQENKKSGNSGGGSFGDRDCHKKTGTEISRVEKANQVDPCHLRTSKSFPEPATSGKPVSEANRNNVAGKKFTSGCSDGLERPDDHSNPRTGRESPESSECPRRKIHRGKCDSPGLSNWSAILSDKLFGPRKRRALKNGENKLARRKLTTVRNARDRIQCESDPKSNEKKGRLMLKKYTILNGPETVEETLCFDVLAGQRSEQKFEKRICQKIPRKLETIEERNIVVDNFSGNTWQPRKSKGCGQPEDKVRRSRSSSKRSTRQIEKTTSTEHIFLTNLIAKLLNRHLVLTGGQCNGKDKRKIDSRYRRDEKCSNFKRNGDAVSRKYATTSVHKHGKRSSMSQKNSHGRKTIEDSAGIDIFYGAGNDEDSRRKKITQIGSMTNTECGTKEKSKGVRYEGSGSSVKVKVLRAIDKNHEGKRFGETCSPCPRSEEKIETRGNVFHPGRKGLESQSEFEEFNVETGGQKDVTFSRANTCERLIVKANVISQPTMDPDPRCVGRTLLIAGQNIRVKMLDDRETSTTGLSEESVGKHDRQKRKISSTSAKKTETKCVRVTGSPGRCSGGKNLVPANDSKSLLRQRKNATPISVGYGECVRKTGSDDTNVCRSNNPEGIRRVEDLPKSRLDRGKLCSLVRLEVPEGCEKAVFYDEKKSKERDDITGGKREPCGRPGCKNERASRSGELLKLYPRTSSAEELHRGVSKVEIDSSANTGNWMKSSGEDLDVTKPESRNIINFYYPPGSNEAPASRRELQTDENGEVKKAEETSNAEQRKPLQRIENPRQVCRANATLNNDDISASVCRKWNSDEDKNDGHSTRERNVSNGSAKNDLHQNFGIENSNLRDVNRVSPEPLIPAIKSPKKSDLYPKTSNKQPFRLSSSTVAKRFGKNREKNENGGPRNPDKKDGGKKSKRESDPNPLTKSSENISDEGNRKARSLLHTETSKVEDPETLGSGKIVKGGSEIRKSRESRKSSESPSLQRSAGPTEKDETPSGGVREDGKVGENKRKKSAKSEKTTPGEALISRSGGNRGVTRTADLSSERLMNGKNLRPSLRPEENLNSHRTSTSKDEELPGVDKTGIPKQSKSGRTGPKRSNAVAGRIGMKQKTEKFADSGINQMSVGKGERNSPDSGSMRSRVTGDSSNIKSGRIPELISRRSMNFKNTGDRHSNNARAESPRKNSLVDCNLENANPAPSGENSSAIHKSDVKDPSRRRVPCNFQAHTNDGNRNGTLTSQCSRVSPDSHKITEKPRNNKSEENPNADSGLPGCPRSKRDSKNFEGSTASSNYSSNEREREIMQHEYENVPDKLSSFSGPENQKNESPTGGCCLADGPKQFLDQGQTFSTAECKRQPSEKKIFCPQNGGQNAESELPRKSERTRRTSEVCKKIAVDQNEKNIPKIYDGNENHVNSMSSIEKAYNHLKTILNKTKNFHKGLLCGKQTKETQFYGENSGKNVKSKTSNSSGSLTVSISFGSSIFANVNTPTYHRKEKNCMKH
ncbi:uncharacterized protein LOC105690106 [Athalia rosae]|uniref:uncharacterized protein LOC105690106 n=1 Tax=Athalia rosae TaxID=37344 RepID=UPI002033E258|nr:uncharacterized protein LOC105690106 [Athalia rosae]